MDLDVHADLSIASISDDLFDTVGYGSLTGLVADIVDGGSFDLLERFAGWLAEAILVIAGVDAVTVTVRKLHPLVPEDLATSGVRIHRTA